MQNQKQPKLFAFKLAQKSTQESTPAPQWKVRDGVAVAACTAAGGIHDNMYRDKDKWNGADGGIYC